MRPQRHARRGANCSRSIRSLAKSLPLKTWRGHSCLSPWARWPTNINENPRQGSGGTIDSVTGRRGRRGSGVVETVCLSDPERAYVPMIVHLPLPLAGASIARDAACEKLSWHALRSRDGRREDVSSDSGNRRTQEDASGRDSGRGRGRRRPVPTPPEWSHAGGTAGVGGGVGRTGGARSGDGIHGPVLEAGVARVGRTVPPGVGAGAVQLRIAGA